MGLCSQSQFLGGGIVNKIMVAFWDKLGKSHWNIFVASDEENDRMFRNPASSKGA